MGILKKVNVFLIGTKIGWFICLKTGTFFKIFNNIINKK